MTPNSSKKKRGASRLNSTRDCARRERTSWCISVPGHHRCRYPQGDRAAGKGLDQRRHRRKGGGGRHGNRVTTREPTRGTRSEAGGRRDGDSRRSATATQGDIALRFPNGGATGFIVAVLIGIIDQHASGFPRRVLENDVVVERPRKIDRAQQHQSKQWSYQRELDHRLAVMAARTRGVISLQHSHYPSDECLRRLLRAVQRPTQFPFVTRSLHG